MPISPSSKLARDARLALWIPILLAALGVLSVISVSMIPPSPSSELVDLGRRVKAAQEETLSAEAARQIEQAAATLEAARRAIEHESQRSWRLRSYDRARNLLRKTELFLERADEAPAGTRANEVVPAG